MVYADYRETDETGGTVEFRTRNRPERCRICASPPKFQGLITGPPFFVALAVPSSAQKIRPHSLLQHVGLAGHLFASLLCCARVCASFAVFALSALPSIAVSLRPSTFRRPLCAFFVLLYVSYFSIFCGFSRSHFCDRCALLKVSSRLPSSGTGPFCARFASPLRVFYVTWLAIPF